VSDDLTFTEGMAVQEHLMPVVIRRREQRTPEPSKETPDDASDRPDYRPA
jgi:hypothetical protein